MSKTPYKPGTYFQVPTALEEDDCYDDKCYCANDNTVRYLGNTLEHNCNIRIEDADFDRHNGTWTCIAQNQFADTVNVTVTTCEYLKSRGTQCRENLMKARLSDSFPG